jgi:hypothetical protein
VSTECRECVFIPSRIWVCNNFDWGEAGWQAKCESYTFVRANFFCKIVQFVDPVSHGCVQKSQEIDGKCIGIGRNVIKNPYCFDN